MEEIKFWGVCPNELCPHSYKNAEGLKESLSAWISENCMPGSGWPRKAELGRSYQNIFQPCSVGDCFCPECGTPLVFKAVFPSLGHCKCQREYNEGELSAAFCAVCGEPIGISDELRGQIAKQKQLKSLFDEVLPLLKKHGFLATVMG